MKINKKLSILLVCALIINMFCTTAVLADDAQVSITGAVTEVAIGTAANNKTPAIALSGGNQNGHSITMPSNGYADFTVYSPIEAVYKLSLCYGSKEGTTGNSAAKVQLSISVGDNVMVNNETIPATGNEESQTWSIVGPHGSVKLVAGNNTIRFARTGGGATFKFVGFKLETVSQTNAVELGTGSMTVNSGSSNCDAGSRNRIKMRANGQFSLNVNAIDAGNYKLYVDNENAVATNMSYNTDAADAIAVDVEAETGNQYLGIVSLASGVNTITLKNNGTSEYSIRKIKLEYTDEKIYASNDMTGESKEFVFRTNAVNDIGVTGGNYSENKNSIALTGKDKYIDYTVNPSEDSVYDVYLSCDAPNGAVTIQMLLNDVAQGEITVVAGTSSRSYRYIGSIALKAGSATKITFKNISTGTGLANSAMDKFKLEKTDKTLSIVNNLELKNIKTYGRISLKKYVHSDDVLWFIAAKYTKSGDNKSMEECKIKSISLSETGGADFNMTDINTTYVIDSSSYNTSDIVEGEIIEVFLLNSKDYTPIVESYEYTYTAADVNQAAGN